MVSRETERGRSLAEDLLLGTAKRSRPSRLGQLDIVVLNRGKERLTG
jgi:hypothetical protein